MSGPQVRAHGRRALAWLRGAGIGVLLTTLVAAAAEAVPVLVRTAPGRFEIAARDGAVGHSLATQAEEVWRWLEAPLGLPAAFPTPIFVRVVSDAELRDGEALRAFVEPGGVVSVWMKESSPELARRALVRGLLLRQAVAWHGATASVQAPLWLEIAAAEWCATRSNPAGLDALKHASRAITPLGLTEILALGVLPAGQRERGVASATWFMTFLQGEATRGSEWSLFLRALLGGENAETALVVAYPGRFSSAEERELWWATGWHQVRRGRSLPSLDIAESREEVAHLARFLAAPEEADIVVTLRQVIEHASEPFVAAELKRRATELGRLAGLLHPFYRNAGLSLAAVFDSVRLGPAKRDAAVAQFESDWRDALELEQASRAALDGFEKRLGTPRP